MTEKKSFRFMCILFAVALALFLSACVRFGSQADKSTSQGKQLYDYLKTADHLTEKQKQSMVHLRPFIGMTMEEANLTMHPDRSTAVQAKNILQMNYIGGGGINYTLFFDGGDPNRVMNFLFLSEKELEELRKRGDLRPDTPVTMPSNIPVTMP